MQMLIHCIKLPNGLMREAVLMDRSHARAGQYDDLLGGFLWGASKRTDYWYGFLDFLQKAEEQGEAFEEITSYNDWYVTVRPQEVEIDFAAKDDFVATFPVRHVRNAVKGWICFLEMPEAESSRLTVDLDAP